MRDDTHFGGNSMEENEKLVEELIENGYESITPVIKNKTDIDDNSQTWKSRYFALLDILKTFKD